MSWGLLRGSVERGGGGVEGERVYGLLVRDSRVK